jgi:hypothetical protein
MDAIGFVIDRQMRIEYFLSLHGDIKAMLEGEPLSQCPNVRHMLETLDDVLEDVGSSRMTEIFDWCENARRECESKLN